MRILHTLALSSVGGTGWSCLRFCRLMLQRGHEVTLLAPGDSLLLEPARQHGIAVRTDLAFPERIFSASFPQDVKRLHAFLRQHQPDLVHAYRPIDSWLAALALRSLGKKGRPRLVRSRLITTPIKVHAPNRWLHERTDLLLCACNCIREQIAARGGLSLEKVRVLLDGIDHRQFRPGRDEKDLRRQWGAGQGEVVVGTVARIDRVKGHLELLAAYKELPPLVRDKVRLVWIGPVREAAYDQSLRRLTRDLVAAGRLVFLGERDDVAACLRAMDIFALTSQGSEGNSRALLEAMATGLPTLTTDAGSFPDYVADEKTGLLSAVGNVPALSADLARLVEDAGLRAALGQAARARIERLFLEEHVAEELEAHYREALGEVSRPQRDRAAEARADG